MNGTRTHARGRARSKKRGCLVYERFKSIMFKLETLLDTHRGPPSQWSHHVHTHTYIIYVYFIVIIRSCGVPAHITLRCAAFIKGIIWNTPHTSLQGWTLF